MAPNDWINRLRNRIPTPRPGREPVPGSPSSYAERLEQLQALADTTPDPTRASVYRKAHQALRAEAAHIEADIKVHQLTPADLREAFADWKYDGRRHLADYPEAAEIFQAGFPVADPATARPDERWGSAREWFATDPPDLGHRAQSHRLAALADDAVTAGDLVAAFQYRRAAYAIGETAAIWAEEAATRAAFGADDPHTVLDSAREQARRDITRIAAKHGVIDLDKTAAEQTPAAEPVEQPVSEHAIDNAVRHAYDILRANSQDEGEHRLWYSLDDVRYELGLQARQVGREPYRQDEIEAAVERLTTSPGMPARRIASPDDGDLTSDDRYTLEHRPYVTTDLITFEPPREAQADAGTEAAMEQADRQGSQDDLESARLDDPLTPRIELARAVYQLSDAAEQAGDHARAQELAGLADQVSYVPGDWDGESHPYADQWQREAFAKAAALVEAAANQTASAESEGKTAGTGVAEQTADADHDFAEATRLQRERVLENRIRHEYALNRMRAEDNGEPDKQWIRLGDIRAALDERAQQDGFQPYAPIEVDNALYRLAHDLDGDKVHIMATDHDQGMTEVDHLEMRAFGYRDHHQLRIEDPPAATTNGQDTDGRGHQLADDVDQAEAGSWPSAAEVAEAKTALERHVQDTRQEPPTEEELAPHRQWERRTAHDRRYEAEIADLNRIEEVLAVDAERTAGREPRDQADTAEQEQNPASPSPAQPADTAAEAVADAEHSAGREAAEQRASPRDDAESQARWLAAGWEAAPDADAEEGSGRRARETLACPAAVSRAQSSLDKVHKHIAARDDAAAQVEAERDEELARWHADDQAARMNETPAAEDTAATSPVMQRGQLDR